MARNAQIWTRDYALLLDGPRATRDELEHAAQVTDEGGRFGYRFLYPAMRAGERELFWHLPLVARPRRDDRQEQRSSPRSLSHALARDTSPRRRSQANAPPITLTPRLLARDGHREAATLFAHERGRRRLTTSFNARKLLEARELLG